MNNSKRFKSFYSKESTEYEGLRYETKYGRVFRQLHHNTLKEALANSDPAAPILEVACGTGHTTNLLTELNFNLIACDLTPAMMQQARQRTQNKKIKPHFIETDAKTLPFSDSTFDTVISTRFLHLFPMHEQEVLLSEMLRVLKPGGKIIVDFDNWFSRWLYSIPFLVYNIIRYKRLAPYSIYNKISATKKMLTHLNVNIEKVYGVGGAHLALPSLFSTSATIKLGKINKSFPFRIFSEQFLIQGIKK